MKRRRQVEEPLSFDSDDVAETLDRHGYERMADFVRQLGRQSQRENQREAQLIAKNDELVKRLRQYEPQPGVRSPVWTGD